MDFDNDTQRPLRGRRRDASKMRGFGAYYGSEGAPDDGGQSPVPPGVTQVGTFPGGTIWSDGSVRNNEGIITHPPGTAEPVSLFDSVRESLSSDETLAALAKNGRWIVIGLIALAVVEVMRAVRR